MEIILSLLLFAVFVLGFLLYRSRSAAKEQANLDRMFRERAESMKNEFRLLSQQVLEQQSRQFAERNEQQIDYLLRPFKTHLDTLNQTIRATNAEETRRKASFEEALRHLAEQTDSIGRQTENLTKALKGESKTQGDWGEMILASILEHSGLTRDQEYSLQYSVKSPDGQVFRPDAVVFFPDDKKVVIDSKVSLTAYMDYLNATDEESRNQAVKAHVQSVRKHTDELAAKAYNRLLGNAGSHVLLFLQSDAAYILAVRNDSQLNEEAFRKGIILTCPTTLMMTLQIIYNIWQSDRQNKNIEMIVRRASSLYDKFAGFVDTFRETGRNLDRTHEAYEKALRQLCEGRGNLVKQAEDLRSMGVTPKKQLPEDILDRAGADTPDSLPSQPKENLD